MVSKGRDYFSSISFEVRVMFLRQYLVPPEVVVGLRL